MNHLSKTLKDFAFKVTAEDFTLDAGEDFLTGDTVLRWRLRTETYRRLQGELAERLFAAGAHGHLEADVSLSSPRGGIGFRFKHSAPKEVLDDGR